MASGIAGYSEEGVTGPASLDGARFCTERAVRKQVIGEVGNEDPVDSEWVLESKEADGEGVDPVACACETDS